MDLIYSIFLLLCGIYFSDAGYESPEQNPQSDVQAPAYVPPYIKNQYGNQGRGYPTKTGYQGRKTAGTKTRYIGTKTGNSGTKSMYSQSKTWNSNPGEAPSYEEFQKNANYVFAPKCNPGCKNNGICIKDNTCTCPTNFEGRFCEIEKKPCLTNPPLPANSIRQCMGADTCVIKCLEGYKFIDGTSAATMRCIEDQWRPTRADLNSIPDCEPECNPPCLNGGVCLSVNTCQCSQDYKGPQCQYSSSVCDARKLAFNGAYNCAGDNNKFSCQLSCPAGSSYSTLPAPEYTCTYDTGVFHPQPIPRCVFNDVIVVTPSNYHPANDSMYTVGPNVNVPQVGNQIEHGTKNPVKVIIQDFTPRGGTCLTWAGLHYKTFDGKVYSFQSPCQHTLVRDATEHKYTIDIKQGVCERQAYCPAKLYVYLDEKLYMLAVGEDGSVQFRSSKGRLLPIPASLPGIRVDMPTDHVIVNLDAAGVTLKWDTNNMVYIEGTVQLWNKTEGLCGTLDGNPENDLMTKEGTLSKTKTAMAASWMTIKLGDICESGPTESTACASREADDVKKAQQFCTKIFSKKKFRKCSEVLDVSLLMEACQWDYCACTKSLSPEECACSTVSVYAKECLRHGVQEMKSWRDSDTCPMKCPDGKTYHSCGPDAQPSCEFPNVPTKVDNTSCVEGCFCPEGLFLESGKCVPKSECPCRLRNKNFKPGAVIPKDCNTCTCESGKWKCTQIACGARCGAVGDPHYTTFDGLRYDFMGHCTYTLLATANFTVDVENVACSGAITEAMNLTPYKGEGQPSCTKAVSLNYDGVSIHMKHGGFILVNGKEVSTLPVNVGDIRIRAASSLFIIVQLPNKVDLWWDGNTRVFVDVPPSFESQTKGLCGTFNLNQKDDFLTPEGDVEQSASAFANKWKTREFCEDVDRQEPEHPCSANVENRETAENYCNKLKSKLFEVCHWYVDVEPYYKSCLYDMCACAGDVSQCLCPILGDYAMVCANSGVQIQWRYNVKECELQCTGGQEFSVCADSCQRTCADVAVSSSIYCKPKCIEGCACPTGQVLDKNNVCVPIGRCPCYHKGMQFEAGYKEVRPGKRERELCTCVGARWYCTPATPEEIQNYPPAEDLRNNCSAVHHMEFTTCEIAEPLTCKNMHLPPTTTTAECRPGCQCKKGYVMDMVSKKCVLATECPCHHGGRSYPDGHIMQEECNKCECKNGNWSCTDRKCSGLCSAWGDSHVTTFDGTEYDFEGVCTYLLAKGAMDSNDGFIVEIQNVPCGTTGATCSKSVTLKVGSGHEEEVVSLTKHVPIPDLSRLKRIKLREAGAYVFLDVPSLGISLQWDRGMRVYVKVDPMWQGRLKGLCGHYNSDRRDDFLTPSGLPEASPLIFANSWALKATCPKPQPIMDHCKQRPERQEWARGACGAMKRFPFTLCHAELPPAGFMERCERDACACDSGDDCECACTALAAYAHACAQRGVTFKWRTQETCPMQCDVECSNYNECVSPCPLETCDNTLYYNDVKTVCAQDTCVEGCKPKKACPEGTVYSNNTFKECVPRAKCQPVCMTLPDGREVLEGEVIEKDDCHTCRCSKKHKVCIGQPCTTIPPQISTELTTPGIKDEPLKCVPGWTPWITRGHPMTGPNGESIENEPLPRANELHIGSPMCTQDKMTKIECRTLREHKSAKETGKNVECSLEKGLVCKEIGNVCPDFEIRLFCECEASPFQCLNSTHPSVPHPTDCNKFYECTPEPGSPERPHQVLKACGPGLMYHPVTMICDWPASVISVRPECETTTTPEVVQTTSPARPRFEETPSEPETLAPQTKAPTMTTTAKLCAQGQVFKECVYPCDRLCDHFSKNLLDKGRCQKERCVGGCVDEEVANIQCDYGGVWRDERTCVPIKDCTCYNDGVVIKPGGVVIDGCKKCQCLDNKLHCDTSECSHLPVISTQVYEETTPTETESTAFPSTVFTPTTPGLVTEGLKTGTTLASTTESVLIITKTTVTPPPECKPDRYKNLLWGEEEIPESSFTASSVSNELYEPQFAVLNGHPIDITGSDDGIQRKSRATRNFVGASWIPKVMDQNQYIQVKLPRKEPVYGVVMQGHPVKDEYITSYEVMYGDDGSVFSTVDGPDDKPKIFRGPVDNNNPVKQMIEPPIEAKFVRIKPLTWHKGIAIRMEFIGCQEPVTTVSTTTVPTTLEPIQCTEPLGLGGLLPIENVEVSSNSELRNNLNLDSSNGWSPIFSTPGEWIKFDFTSPRNITGIKTKGGPSGWVTSYNIFYTSDLSTFNPVLAGTGNNYEFLGNIDQDTVVENQFRPPIRAQYLKLVPKKWKDHIEIRVEPIGCFEPYPTTEPEPIYNMTPQGCKLCPGVEPATCSCEPGNYYDGENCVPREQCPCVKQAVMYAVGSSFRGDNCDECICKLGGVTECKPVNQCKCAPNLVARLDPSNCQCVCSACPVGTAPCSSGLCLSRDKWCDGLQDCPDDESNCGTTAFPALTTEPMVFTTVAPTVGVTKGLVTTPEPPKQCPKVECPLGYQVRKTSPRPSPGSELVPPRPRYSYHRYQKSSKGRFSKGGFSKGGYSYPGSNRSPSQNQAFSLNKPVVDNAKSHKSEECEQFRCIPRYPPVINGQKPKPLICSTPSCPDTYILKLESTPQDHKGCPQYVCEPPPERPAFCNMTGRTFSTFDGATFKYDVCYHLLARENRLNSWTVLVRKKCQVIGYQKFCSKELLLYQDDQIILVKPNLMIEYNNFEYTIEQTNKICFQKNSFNVHRLGNGVSISSRKYDFTVLYNSDGDIKIGVPKKLMGSVDGLCGAFDGDIKNDRRLPNGLLAASTEEFGHAWGKPGLPPDTCEVKPVTPEDKKNRWDLCEVITKEPFSKCGEVLDLHKWRGICLEKMCDCVDLVVNGTKNTEEQCRCLLLEQMVAECLAANKNLDINDWRINLNCPADCPPPLVHYDCYRKRCEPTCSTVGSTSRSCPVEDGQCFPGCYCPEGKLRKGDQCVVPSDCLDCTCTGVGTPAKYEPFEGDNLPFVGNCTYLASRDRNETGKHKYQVYATNGKCETSSEVCTEIVHVLYENKLIKIYKDNQTQKLITTIDKSPVFKYPVKKDWVTINLINGNDIVVNLPDAHVEVTVVQSKMSFLVRLPSSLYTNRTEGLCGVCAGYLHHLLTSNGTATDDFEEYGKSWQASPSTLSALDVDRAQCEQPPPTPDCIPPPPDQNPCYNIYNPDKFGACHALVDPQQYVETCESQLCANTSDICPTLETYAAECRRQGVCLDWRTPLCQLNCSEPFVYRPCVDCERTCDNHDQLKRNPGKCDKLPVEGCFCPEGKVRVNNTCIEPTKCFPCDANNEHFAGDEWQEDACTKCTCRKVTGEGGHVQAQVSCTTQTCSSPVCSDDHIMITKLAKPGDCCPDHMCVSKPKSHCIEPKQMECGFGQVLKQKTKPNGCKEFACECKPASECEHIPEESEVDIVEPGMQRYVERSGCCPRVSFVCSPHTCPRPPTCPTHHTLNTANVTDKCCPQYKCELPKDKCLVKLEWEAAPKGGEKASSAPKTVLKDIDAVWQDGPCRSCTCTLSDVTPAYRCTETNCIPVRSTEQFVLEPTPVPFSCCPVPAYVACRHADNTYEAGQNWTSPNKPCEVYQCVQTDDGKLEKVTTVQTCDTNCQPGWKYFPAIASDQCCGKCKPVSCVVDGQEHPINDKWTSADFCTNYTCVDLNGTLQVQSSNETCPEVPTAIRKQFELKEEKLPGKCCKTQEPVKCRVGNDIYQEGESWPSPDPCKNITCSRDVSGRLTHAESVESCVKECSKGWRYRAPDVGCCGRCVKEACIVDGEVKNPESWPSPDPCKNITCSRDVSGRLTHAESVESCVKECSKGWRYRAPDVGCCGRCVKEACIVDGEVKNPVESQEGESWPSPDPCKNITCSRDVSGRLTHAESVESCVKECSKGWRYRAPDVGCCGRCVKEACIVDGEVKNPGTTWQSPDNCTTYSCEKSGDDVFVTLARRSCPDVSGCDPDDIVNDTCCQLCIEKPKSLSKCVPTSLPGLESVGIIRTRLTPHGMCFNKQPILTFKECRGSCDSGTMYNNHTGVHDSKCECCQVSKYESIIVEVDCEDGTRQQHRVGSPSKCSCQACGPTISQWKPGYQGTKTPTKTVQYAEPADYDIPDIYQRFGEAAKPPR